MTENDMPDVPAAGKVKLAFEPKTVTVSIEHIVALKNISPEMKASKKYLQILSSVRSVGIIEPPAIARDQKHRGQYFLLDGHLRIEALKDIGLGDVECLISTDDEAYTYNKRINRLAAIQEHRMIVKAVERGVSEERIAEALGLDAASIRRRFRMLDGICKEAIDLLKDTSCPMKIFDILRRMTPIRQMEAADLMIGQNNFTAVFAQAILAATPDKQLAGPQKKKTGRTTAATAEQMARMERELANLQTQVTSVEETYGLDNLHLTVAKGYIAKLLANARIVRWLAQNRQEYVTEFQTIAEMESIGNLKAIA
jgi:hypothetical protein